jgi:hypothetical protein
VKGTLIVCGIVGLVVLLVPIPSSETPLWTVCVVDEVNKPAAGVKVRESYRNYSAEFNDGERDLTTDGKGCVAFPAKRLWAPLAQRGAAIMSRFLPLVVVEKGMQPKMDLSRTGRDRLPRLNRELF